MIDQYSKAPITEAVIELRTAEDVKTTLVDKAHGLLRKRYQKSERLIEFKVIVGSNSGSETTPMGYKLTSEAGDYVVQARRVGLGISQLAPYPGWTAFTAEFEEAYRLWIKAVGRKPLSRIGVRFLNRIDVPIEFDGQLIESDDYLNVGVKLPELTRNGALAWQSATISQVPDTPFKLRLACASAEGALIDHASYQLDIDLYCDVDVPQADDDIWALLAQARDMKNRVFEECISSRTRALIS